MSAVRKSVLGRKALLSAGAAVMVLAGVLTGCGSETAPRALAMGSSGSAVDTVMAQIYAGALRHAGAVVSTEVRVGDDRRLLAEMGHTEVDLFPSFTGRLLSQLAPTLTSTTPDDVYVDLNHSLPEGISVGDPTPVTNTPELVVSTRLASGSAVSDLSACSRLPADLPTVVVDPPTDSLLRAFADAGCRLGPLQRVVGVQSVVDRVASGGAVGILTPLQVSGVTSSGSAGAVQALATPKITKSSPATPTSTPSVPVPSVGPRAEVLVPVYRTAALSPDQVKAINKVAGEISTADLVALARRVESGENPADVATGWLGEHSI